MKGNPLELINARRGLMLDGAAERAKAIVRRDAAKQAAIERLSRNGITPKDLENEYRRGYDDARKDLTAFTMRMFYCAAALAARELHGFGEQRIIRLLNRIQQIMTEEICTADIAERLRRETGIDIFDSDYDN